LGFPLSKLCLSALGEDLGDGALGRLSDLHICVGKWKTQLLGYKWTDGAFSRTAQAEEPYMGGSFHRSRVAGNRLLGECGVNSKAWGKGFFRA
jgi:hypothetical protein